MRKISSGGLVAALIISLISLIELPAANGAACSVEYGTVSGTTRYAKVTSGNGCTWTVPTGVTSLSYLVVGGGGGGGGARMSSSYPNLGGGGGGAGGYVLSSSISVTAGGTLTMTVGTGGAGGAASNSGGNGSTSSLSYSSTTISAVGGNGGGGASGSNDSSNLAGDGGGNSYFNGGYNNWDGGGGGAGAGANGVDGTDIGGQGGNGGNGGTGVGNSLLTGSTIYYGGGGGGGGTPYENSNEVSGTYGTGGSSVGGNGGGYGGGGANDMRQPTSPVANSGGGGGGGGWRSSWTDAQRAGSAGANGVIVITFAKNAATISSLRISSTPAFNNTYGFGAAIDVEVTFSEAITVSGTPRIPVVGLTSKYFNYYSGSGTDVLIFRYTTVNNDFATAGVGVTANTLELNAGTLKDTGGIASIITHSAIAISSNQRVDVVVPVVSTSASITIDENTTAVATLAANETVTWSFLPFNEFALFSLNSSTGVLTISARDFENPQDASPYNSYMVRIRAADLGANITDKTFTVTIRNVVETATVNTPTISGAAIKGKAVTLTAVAGNAGKIQFNANGKKIPRCVSVSTSGSSPNFSATCSWIPSVVTRVQLTATIIPSDTSTLSMTSLPIAIQVSRRNNTR